MDFFRRDEITVFANPGMQSRQLLFPGNSPEARATITRVELQPGSRNLRHTHPTSEQVWVALRGTGLLLLADDATMPFAEGDVVRFAQGDIHGLHNTGSIVFEYLSVTTPPLDFRGAYATSMSGGH